MAARSSSGRSATAWRRGRPPPGPRPRVRGRSRRSRSARRRAPRGGPGDRDRTRSTARLWDWAKRKDRRAPRAGSKRSGWFHSRRKTSWATSSASPESPVTRLASPNTAAAVAPVDLGQGFLPAPADGHHQLGVSLPGCAPRLPCQPILRRRRLFGWKSTAVWHRPRPGSIQGAGRPRRDSAMRTTIDCYKSRAGRLDISGIDFDAFAAQPLSPEALRCLRYMHDVEYHTVCYLRDLLLTPAHRDPEITTFLSCWVFEELWHGEAIGEVLAAHGEVSGSTRIAPLRQRRRRRDRLGCSPISWVRAWPASVRRAAHVLGRASTSGRPRPAMPGLAPVSAHPVLSELLRRIMNKRVATSTSTPAEARGACALDEIAEADPLGPPPPLATSGLGRHARARSVVPRRLPACGRRGPGHR